MLSEREWLLKRVPFSIGHEFKLTQSEGIVGRRGWVLFNFVRRSLCIRVTMALGRTIQLVGRGRVKGGKSVRGLEVRIEWMTERGPSGRGITSFIGVYRQGARAAARVNFLWKGPWHSSDQMRYPIRIWPTFRSMILNYFYYLWSLLTSEGSCWGILMPKGNHFIAAELLL